MGNVTVVGRYIVALVMDRLGMALGYPIILRLGALKDWSAAWCW